MIVLPSMNCGPDRSSPEIETVSREEEHCPEFVLWELSSTAKLHETISTFSNPGFPRPNDMIVSDQSEARTRTAWNNWLKVLVSKRTASYIVVPKPVASGVTVRMANMPKHKG